MNKIYIIGGGKGGVGKSAVVFALVDLLLAKGEQVILVESDDSNPDTYKSLNEVVTSAVICSLDDEAGYIKLTDTIADHMDACIVINTAARVTASLIKYGEIFIDEAKKQTRPVIMLWAMNRQRDSVELLKDFLDGSNNSYDETYAVLNTYFGPPEKFSRYAESKQKNRITDTVVFPDLNDTVADKVIDNRLSLNAAEVVGGVLSTGERSALNRYRLAAHKALEVVL